MANSWIEAAGLFGLDLALACPDGFAPDAQLVATRTRSPARCPDRARITLTTDPKIAVAGATVISTDVWASMGAGGRGGARRAAFAGFCVDGGARRARRPMGPSCSIACRRIAARRSRATCWTARSHSRGSRRRTGFTIGKAILEAVL